MSVQIMANLLEDQSIVHSEYIQLLQIGNFISPPCVDAVTNSKMQILKSDDVSRSFGHYFLSADIKQTTAIMREGSWHF